MGTKLAAALWLSALEVTSAQAAEITRTDLSPLTVVDIDGDIIDGDYKHFLHVISGRSIDIVVRLNSSGGLIGEAMAIGATVRERRFSTAVINNATCASACGLIWLAGVHRYKGGTGQIGFHAAYDRDGDDARISGPGNAVVGAYLSDLGLTMNAIVYLTSKAPSEIQWLDPDEARRVGISFNMLPDPKPATASTAAATPIGTPFEGLAIQFVSSYWAALAAGSDVIAYYAPTLVFYGDAMTQAQAVAEKRKYADRWPVRHFTIKPNTVFVQCIAVTCSVTGAVDWDFASVERNARSVGTASFVLKIALNGSSLGGVIVSENGNALFKQNGLLSETSVASTVLPTSKSTSSAAPGSAQPVADGAPDMSPEQRAASITASYAEGRRVRIDYENWFATLPFGQYRDGAEFWATNRSAKPTPSCSQPTNATEWQQGCIDARIKLTPADVRRKSDRNFWWGWNSL